MALAGCRRGGDKSRPMVIERLDKYVAAGDVVPAGMRDAAGFYDRVMALSSLHPSVAVSAFQPAVDSLLPDLDPVEARLGVAFGYLKRELPDAGRFRLYAVVSPFDRSIYMSDTLMLVALNHYLGWDFDGYSRFPEYQRRLKTPERIPFDAVESAVAGAYPRQAEPEGATVLGRMLYEGAVVTAMVQAFPDATEAEVLGYTPDEWDWLVDNEGRMWHELVGKELLFSASEPDAERLLMPAPATALLGSEVPGRAGRFLGYRIVTAYRKRHKAVTVAQLLRPDFYNAASALREAAYNPAVN